VCANADNTRRPSRANSSNAAPILEAVGGTLLHLVDLIAGL
jgi:hypothetical protein